MSKTFAQIAHEARQHPMYEELKHRAYERYITGIAISRELKVLRDKNRVWFYRPQMHWHGWSTLLPVIIGHDEYARKTLMLGWTITGRVIIALGGRTEHQCLAEVLERLDKEHEEWILSL